MEECSRLMQNLMQIHCSTCSVILNAMTTQYTWALNGIYHAHWLTSTVKSSLFTHAHSSPLPLAARLHWCCANCSHYIKQWVDFFQTDLRCLYKNWHMNVHRSVIYNSPKVETTQMPVTGEQRNNMWPTHTMECYLVLKAMEHWFMLQHRWIWKQYAKWKKPVTKGHLL